MDLKKCDRCGKTVKARDPGESPGGWGYFNNPNQKGDAEEYDLCIPCSTEISQSIK